MSLLLIIFAGAKHKLETRHHKRNKPRPSTTVKSIPTRNNSNNYNINSSSESVRIKAELIQSSNEDDKVSASISSDENNTNNNYFEEDSNNSMECEEEESDEKMIKMIKGQEDLKDDTVVFTPSKALAFLPVKSKFDLTSKAHRLRREKDPWNIATRLLHQTIIEP